MKILPVNLNMFSAVNNNRSCYQTPHIRMCFNGEDSFSRTNSFVNEQIRQLENDVNNKVLPYREEHREEFIALGKIGYDSQAVLMKQNL